MIYEILFDKKKDYNYVFETLSKLGGFCFMDNLSFLHTEHNIDCIKSMVDEKSFLSLNIVDKNNVDKIQNYMIRKWCREKLIEDEFKEFECSEKTQNQLSAIMNYLDVIENLRKDGEENRKEGKARKPKGTKENNNRRSRSKTKSN